MHSLVSRVKYLQYGWRAAAFSSLRKPAQTGNEPIIVGGKFVRETNAVFRHVRAPGQHEPDSTGSGTIPGEFLIGNRRVRVG